MAKYKKKRVQESAGQDAGKSEVVLPKTTSKAPSQLEPITEKKVRKLEAGSVKLEFAGDLVMVRNTQKPLSGLFKRYAELFEALANMDKEQRNLLYRFLTGLMLTSHAKKATQTEAKRKLFDLKNEIFLLIANDRSLRRLVEFKYLISKNFRVIAYCEECVKKNTEQSLDRHKWKYCKKCQVDHNFYNLLSMEIRFPQGLARMFVSNDQLPKLKGFKLPRKMRAGDLKEEALFDRYHYNIRNLDAINLESVMMLYQKVSATTPTSKRY